MTRVKYSGKRLPLKLNMPWMNDRPCVFGESREADMDDRDAERLCREAPSDFSILKKSADKPQPERKPTKPAVAVSRKRKKAANKE